MKRLSLFLILSAMVTCSLFGCSPNPSKVSDKRAEEFVDKITYVKDYRTGACFVIIAIQGTMNGNQNTINFTWVPCEQVEKYLVNRK